MLSLRNLVSRSIQRLPSIILARTAPVVTQKRFAARYKGDLQIVTWEVPDVSREPQKDKLSKDPRSFTNRAWREAGQHKIARGASLMHGVMPNVVPTFLPIINLLVEYPASLIHRGNWMTPTETAQAPAVNFKAEKDSLWTLFMVSPDIPSKEQPTGPAFVHWLVSNIPGDDISDVKRGQEVVPYLQPIPTRNAGATRFVFVLALQQGHVSLDYNSSDFAHRSSTKSVGDLMSEWNMSPKGLSFFQAEFDETVDETYEKHKESTVYVPTKKQLKEEEIAEGKEIHTRMQYDLLKL